MPNNFLKLFSFIFLHYLMAFFIFYLILEFCFKLSIYSTILWNMNFCLAEYSIWNSFFHNQLIYSLLIKLLILRDIWYFLLIKLVFTVNNIYFYWKGRGVWIERNANITASAQIVNIPRWCSIVIVLSIVLELYTIIMNLIIINIYSNLSYMSSFLNVNTLSVFNLKNFFLNNSLDIFSTNMLIEDFYYWYPEFILFFIIIFNFFVPYLKIVLYKSEKYLLFLKFSIFICTFTSLIYFLEFKNLYLSNLFYLNKMVFFFQFCIFFFLLAYLYNLNLSYYFRQNINGKYYKSENFYFYEFYSLLFCAILISTLALKSNNLFFLWFNMEILSILAYFLSSFGNSDRRLVSSFIYFVFNSLAGGIILFGITILLKNFSSDYDLTTSNFQNFFFLTNYEYKLGLFFILIGFLVKLGLFPFHFWNIKTYGEITPRIFFFFVLVYKIILFFLFYRLTTSFFINIFSDINSLLILCCIISSFIGGVGACYEISIQRFLAYTSLVQSAYIVGGYLSNTIETISSSLIYTVSYFFVFLGFYFSITLLLSNKNLFFSDLPTLYYINPFVGILFIFYMFILIGIPPSILFFSKFLLFLNIFFTGNYFMFFVFLIVSIFTAIYYLNVIVSILQTLAKKNTLIQTSDEKNFSQKNDVIFYQNFAIDTKKFYVKPDSYDFNSDVLYQEPTQFYKISEFFKYLSFHYTYLGYFFYLIIYFIFIIFVSIFFLYFYNGIFSITENLIICNNFTISTSSSILFVYTNFDIVTNLKNLLNIKKK